MYTWIACIYKNQLGWEGTGGKLHEISEFSNTRLISGSDDVKVVEEPHDLPFLRPHAALEVLMADVQQSFVQRGVRRQGVAGQSRVIQFYLYDTYSLCKPRVIQFYLYDTVCVNPG